MPIATILWKYKKWIAIAVFIFLYLVQIAYTNHLSGKLQEAEQKCSAKVQKLKDDQQKALIEKQNHINKVSADYEQLKSEQRVKVETVTREVQKIVERPVYSNICIDADGLRIINSLISDDSS
jgi:Tfp pilus assembly protein PilO